MSDFIKLTARHPSYRYRRLPCQEEVNIFHITSQHDRFIEKANVYVQRRSIGAFIGVLIGANGSYRTSCEIVVVEARKAA